ncbi:hypothetical protein HGA91_02990 [candidate division WWE3 bacterium]|nr:hypothetical protein [candidate division WWE3 bacterium]
MLTINNEQQKYRQDKQRHGGNGPDKKVT